MGFWILEIAWTFGIGSTSHKKKVDDIYPQKNDGGMGEIFHASLLSSSSKKQFIPWKMQSRKINRLEAEEDLVEVVYRVCDGKKYTQIFLKLCLGIAVFFFNFLKILNNNTFII